MRPRIINGIDVDRHRASLTALREAPNSTRCLVLARSEWITGNRTRTTVRCRRPGEEPGAASQLEGTDLPSLLEGGPGVAGAGALLHVVASSLASAVSHAAAFEGLALEAMSFDLETEISLAGLVGLPAAAPSRAPGVLVLACIRADAPRNHLLALLTSAGRTTPVLALLHSALPLSLSLRHQGSNPALPVTHRRPA